MVERNPKGSASLCFRCNTWTSPGNHYEVGILYRYHRECFYCQRCRLPLHDKPHLVAHSGPLFQFLHCLPCLAPTTIHQTAPIPSRINFDAIAGEIAQRLNLESLMIMSCVCRVFRQACSLESLWLAKTGRTKVTLEEGISDS